MEMRGSVMALSLLRPSGGNSGSLCVFYQGHERRTISLSAINSTVSFEADYPSVEAKGNKGLGDNQQHWGAEVPLLPGGNAPFRFCHNSKIIITKIKKKHLPP